MDELSHARLNIKMTSRRTSRPRRYRHSTFRAAREGQSVAPPGVPVDTLILQIQRDLTDVREEVTRLREAVEKKADKALVESYMEMIEQPEYRRQ